MTAWTQGRINAFITAVLRRGSSKWPPKYTCLNNAKTEKKVNVLTGRLAQHYQCAMCKNEFTSKDIVVDHLEPVVHPEEGFISWDVYIKRLYCDISNLQAICLGCHKVKSTEENKQRKRKNHGRKENSKD